METDSYETLRVHTAEQSRALFDAVNAAWSRETDQAKRAELALLVIDTHKILVAFGMERNPS